VVCGSPRSGTTWLAQTLASAPRSAMLFEPLHLDHVPRAALAGYSWRTYIRPGDGTEAQKAFMTDVLSGRVLNWWTALDLGRPRRIETWVVKFVRANRLLGWMASEFPLHRLALVVRHPCAAVVSQIEFRFPADEPRSDEVLFADFPRFADIVSTLETDEERRAAEWAMDLVVPLSHPQPHPWHILTFEGLVTGGPAALEPVLSAWDVPMPATMPKRFETWSRTTSRVRRAKERHSIVDDWSQRLRSDQVRRILAVTNAFGIDFYGEDPAPDERRLRGWQWRP